MGKAIRSRLTNAEVVRPIKFPKMCERALVRCQSPALPYTHPQTGSNTNRRYVVTPRNQGRQESRAEPEGTVQPLPTVRSRNQRTAVRGCNAVTSGQDCKAVTSGQSCKAVTNSPAHQPTDRKAVLPSFFCETSVGGASSRLQPNPPCLLVHRCTSLPTVNLAIIPSSYSLTRTRASQHP